MHCTTNRAEEATLAQRMLPDVKDISALIAGFGRTNTPVESRGRVCNAHCGTFPSACLRSEESFGARFDGSSPRALANLCENTHIVPNGSTSKKLQLLSISLQTRADQRHRMLLHIRSRVRPVTLRKCDSGLLRKYTSCRGIPATSTAPADSSCQCLRTTGLCRKRHR